LGLVPRIRTWRPDLWASTQAMAVPQAPSPTMVTTRAIPTPGNPE